MTTVFADIAYYDKSKLLVAPNTYIFALDSYGEGDSAFRGGSVKLEITLDDPPQVIDYGDYTVTYGSQEWLDTSVTANVDNFVTPAEYLKKTYADPVSDTYAKKLDAVMGGLYQISLYPKIIRDRSKPNATVPYPSLAVSPYKELGLIKHIENYDESDEQLFSEYIYPYVLSSLSFPGLLGQTAKLIDPACTVSGTGIHSYIQVNFSDGTSGMFGGAGSGTSYPIYLELIQKDYDFTKISSVNVEDAENRYSNYSKASGTISDELLAGLSEEAVAQHLPNGGWAKVSVEGESLGSTAYAYFYVKDGKAYYVSDCWADGRYVNECEGWESGVSFADHPTASIYSDGTVFNYSSNNDRWESSSGQTKYDSSTKKYIWVPDKTLSHDQVNAMHVDANTNTKPAHGAVYNGTAEPGTAF